MGMSTYVVAIAPPDETWMKMKAIWDTCREGGIEPPREVSEFFNHEEPDSAGVRIDLHRHAAVREYSDDDRQGLEVEIAKLPPQVKILRFVNSW